MCMCVVRCTELDGLCKRLLWQQTATWVNISFLVFTLLYTVCCCFHFLLHCGCGCPANEWPHFDSLLGLPFLYLCMCVSPCVSPPSLALIVSHFGFTVVFTGNEKVKKRVFRLWQRAVYIQVCGVVARCTLLLFYLLCCCLCFCIWARLLCVR